LDYGAVLLATCIISAFATILMGIFARYPIALAPGMGENFFFVSVVTALAALGFANAWQTALGVVFISGLVFLLISILGAQKAIINAMSDSLRSGITVGIGLFIAFIGMRNGGLIVIENGLIGLNSNMLSADVIVFAFGLMVAAGLLVRKVRGSILWGIAAAAILALILGKVHYDGIFGLPEITTPAAFKLDIASAFSLVCLPFIVIFIFMDVFDTLGTLIGVTDQAGFIKHGELPRAKEALTVDAVGTIAGACVGTSTITSYIESAVGVAYGGRTGLTSVITGILFLLALLFSPLIAMVGGYAPITACALVVVGVMMAGNIRKIAWDDYSEAIPAFLIMLGIPLSFQIADGLALGFISYPIVKFLGGQGREVNWLMYFIAAVLLLYFIFVR
jgi:AGZA family xanthine/uracil permease-like MFS transporter